MTKMAKRVQSFGTTIFTEMTTLAQAHQAVNLGQGFPDFEAPAFVKTAAQKAIAAGVNQYAPLRGRPRMCTAVAVDAARQLNRPINPDTEVAIMVGATEGLFAAVMGTVDPGDEVILFEPYYDCYVPAVQFAGGVHRTYTLRPPEWEIDPDRLEALFSDKTKLIIVNTPHNPTGKVFSHAELETIAALCRKYDVIAVVDGVYEHLVFDGRKHIQLAALDGMWERTITVSSLGKTFSVTGWKVGWTVAPAELITAVMRVYQFVTFSGVAPMQEAAADALETAAATDYYADLAALYQQKRDALVETLTAVGLPSIRPAGTYFVMVDISELDFENDVAFCRYLTTDVGVAAIPPSAFYDNPADGAGLARFAFCKGDAALAEADKRLRRHFLG